MAAMVGQVASDFLLPDTDGYTRTLHEFHHLGPLVLLFLPSVFGWRPRWQFWSLLRHYDQFIERATEVVVVAADPVPDLRIFQLRLGFPFVFLADRDARVAAAYEIAPGAAAALVINVHGVIRYRRMARIAWRTSAPGLLRIVGRLQPDEKLPAS